MGRMKSTHTHLPRHLRVSRGAYYHVMRRDGRDVWKPLGRDYGQALRLWAELEAEKLTARTVADLVAGYLADCGGRLKPSTVTGYREFSRPLLAVFGGVECDALRREDVARYVRARNSYAGNRERALLSAAYTWGRNVGLVASDPTKGLNLRAKEAPRQRYVTDTELAALLAAAGRLRPVIELAYLTGLRRGDLLALRVMDGAEAGIAVRIGKTGAVRVIEWTDALRAAWRACTAGRIGASPVIAGRRGQPYTAVAFRQAWECIRERAGLPDVRFHDLRRKAGSDLPLDHAAQLLAHADSKITARHYHAKPVSVRPVR